MGFVGNYAPCGLSPQTDGMPVILIKQCRLQKGGAFLQSALSVEIWKYYIKIIAAFRYRCLPVLNDPPAGTKWSVCRSEMIRPSVDLIP